MTSVCRRRSQLTITLCELNSVSTQSITANCLLKHKAMDSENILIFYVLVGVGWGMGGVGMDGGSPEGTTTPSASLASQVQGSSVYFATLL